ncbi:SDR family NAD(P)-dependent oxidoreductase [Spirosoma flavum]|uniref:SDR family NAD(P)-dependent oxidoreductase n=1 Tax=Spirosoma flavum TaxID=2048557 RepID=A0ABW6AQ48_9BACT
MTTTKQKTALITGASSGIGYELAKLFAQDGINLVLVARRKSLLEEIEKDFEQRYKIIVHCVELDLALLDSPAQLYQFCQKNNLQVDYLVNNAGYGDYGKLVTVDPALYQNMLTLNVLTITTLTSLFVRDMVQRRFGYILNIGSLAAFQPVPQMAVYGASKTYVMHFTEALHAELRGTGVKATVLNPGVTETGFVERANMGGAAYAQGTLLKASRVALAGYRGMMAGKLNVVPGFFNKLLSISTGLTPSRRVLLAISSFVMRGK